MRVNRERFESDASMGRPEFSPPSLRQLFFAIFAGIALEFFGYLDPIAHMLSVLPHELGHTLVYWIGGQPAVPVSFGIWGVTVALSQGFTWWWFLPSILVAYFLMRRCRRRGYRFLAFLFGAFIVLEALFTALAPAPVRLQAAILGGMGGETVLSLLAIMLSFSLFPYLDSKPGLRLVILFGAAWAFVRSVSTWFHVWSGRLELPHRDAGAVLGVLIGDGLPCGDADSLIRDYGWTSGQIVAANVTLAALSIAALVLFIAWKGFLERTESEIP